MLNLSRCCNHNYSRFIAVLYYQFYCSLAFGYTSLGLFYLSGETPHSDETPEKPKRPLKRPLPDDDDLRSLDSYNKPTPKKEIEGC